MSWSFSGIGKPKAVELKAFADLARYRCAEPEATIKGQALKIIQTALEAFPEAAAVQVDASGSQTPDGTTGKFTNSLSLSIKPIYGFVE